MLVRDIRRYIQGEFSKHFRGQPSSSLTYRPGSLPSVRHYAEKKLKRIIQCDDCGNKYAVYGIALFCPRCGRGNLHLHLKRSSEVIRTLLEMKSEIENQAGTEAGYHLLGNCLEDCVSLFEGFLKTIYSQALRFTVSDQDREQKLTQLKNAFQNLSRAETIFRSDFGWDIFDSITHVDREFMELQFAKRHVITHNLGLVDDRFREQANSWQSKGQDVELSDGDISRLLGLLEQVLLKVIERLQVLGRRT